VTKDEYRKNYMSNFVNKYFGNSFQDMVSFFASDRNITLSELEEIRKLLSEEIKKQRAKENE
jgi:predicted transcriptional regulator